jgi:2-oxoglutarate decarboxylase
VRFEQYYPLAQQAITDVVNRYPHAEIVWVQEEPENQGAWPFMLMELAPRLPLGRTISVVSRPASAATATGSSKRSAAEQTDLINRAFAL